MTSHTSDTAAIDASDLVRPFLVTGGRTKSSIDGLRFETLIQSTDRSGSDLRFEPAQVFELAQGAIAIAEIATSLDIPVVTVKVVVGDLVNSGHIDVHDSLLSTGADDDKLIGRLIDGIRRL